MLGRIAQPARDVFGGIGDDQRPAAHPDRDARERRRDDDGAALGGAARFFGWLEGEELARAYADADLFLFCSQTDTFGQVVIEAQASGLPIVAVAVGGPAELIASGRTGVLCPPCASVRAAECRARALRAPRRVVDLPAGFSPPPAGVAQTV